MPNDTGDLLLGLALGAVAVIAIVALIKAMDDGGDTAAAPRQGGPGLVQHNVMRDDRGRIEQVETFRGLQGAPAAHAAGIEGPQGRQDSYLQVPTIEEYDGR